MPRYMKKITETKGVDNVDILVDVLTEMHKEGNGTLTAEVVTQRDAAQMAIMLMLGVGTGNIYIQELNEFFISLHEIKPACFCHECNKDLLDQKDVGIVVIMHGNCELATAVTVSGLCESCWKGRCEMNPDKAMTAFIDHIKLIIPDFEIIKPVNTDPAFRMPDIPFDPNRLN